MRKRNKFLSALPLFCALCIPAFGQQVTTEMIGPLTGTLDITFPNSPCDGQQDTITFNGEVHVVATVDSSQNMVDYHFNLASVKGTGTMVSKYVGNGAVDLLDQGFPGADINVTISISANLFPNGPCRAGFPAAGALPIVVTLSFNPDLTLNAVSATVGET
jgi:hypothetical protein